MHIRSFPGMYALRFPHRAPEDDLGGGETIDLDAEFGADPDAAEPDPEPAAEPVTEEPAEEPAAEEPAAEETPEGEEPAAEEEIDPDAEEPATGRKTDWRDRQIAKRNKELADERAEKAALKAENDALKALATPVDGEAPVVVTPEQARKEALEVVRQEQYAERINTGLKKLDESGSKAFPKSWETRVAQAAEIFGPEMAAKPHFLEALTDLDNSAQVYHDLTGDPDRLEALLNMSPVKMGVELARLSTKLAAKPAVVVSRAPAPITPMTAPKLVERSLDDLANDDSPEAFAELDRRMAADERKRFEAERGR